MYRPTALLLTIQSLSQPNSIDRQTEKPGSLTQVFLLSRIGWQQQYNQSFSNLYHSSFVYLNMA